jgi:hypothetical protein
VDVFRGLSQPFQGDSGTVSQINPLTPELHPFAQRYMLRFFTGILIFKGLSVRLLYKSFGVKGLSGSQVLA